MTEPLKQPKLKLMWARRHIEQLKDDIGAFIMKEPYTITAHEDPETGLNIPSLVVGETAPEHWALMIGDAIHNLRSGLDILANDFLASHGRAEREWYFPISTSEKGFKSSQVGQRPRLPEDLAPEVLEVFRAVQPYITGDNTLRAIHDFNIADKHKLIVTTSLTAEVPVAVFRKSPDPTNPGKHEIIIALRDTAAKHGDKIKATFDVSAGDPPKIEARPVLRFLNVAADEVANVIKFFETKLPK